MKPPHALRLVVLALALSQLGAQRREPANTHTYVDQQQRKLDDAENYYKAGNYREAARIYGEIYGTISLFRLLIFHSGYCFTMLGDDTSAETRYRQAIADNLVDSKTWDALGNKESIQGSAYFELGRIDVRREAWDTAVGNFQAAIAVDPKNWVALQALGIVYADHYKDYAQAIQSLEAALRVQPDEASIKQVLAICHNEVGAQFAQNKDFARATASFQQALSYNPDYKKAADNLARMKAREARAKRPRRVAPAPTPSPESDAPAADSPGLAAIMTKEFFGDVDSGDPSMVEMDLQRDPRLAAATDPAGRSALFHVVYAETAEALVNGGADVNFRAPDGATPLDAALALLERAEAGKDEALAKRAKKIIDFLREHGAKPAKDLASGN